MFTIEYGTTRRDEMGALGFEDLLVRKERLDPAHPRSDRDHRAIAVGRIDVEVGVADGLLRCEQRIAKDPVHSTRILRGDLNERRLGAHLTDDAGDPGRSLVSKREIDASAA